MVREEHKRSRTLPLLLVFRKSEQFNAFKKQVHLTPRQFRNAVGRRIAAAVPHDSFRKSRFLPRQHNVTMALCRAIASLRTKGFGMRLKILGLGLLLLFSGLAHAENVVWTNGDSVTITCNSLTRQMLQRDGLPGRRAQT
jgi:hypothetical protein